MNLFSVLSGSHSLETTLRARDMAISDPEEFKELVSLVCGPDEELARRAAWALGKAGEARPEWLLRHLDQLIEILRQDGHPALKRNVYRILQYTEIPEESEAGVFDLCLNDLDNPRQPAAVRVFAMTVAADIASKEPELGLELKLTIERHMPHGSAGFRNRGAKILKRLK